MSRIPYYDGYSTGFRFSFIPEAEREVMKNGGYHQPVAYCSLGLVGGIWIRNIIVSIGQTEKDCKPFAPWDVYVYFPNKSIPNNRGASVKDVVTFDSSDLRTDVIADIEHHFRQWWKLSFNSEYNTFKPNDVRHSTAEGKDDIPFANIGVDPAPPNTTDSTVVTEIKPVVQEPAIDSVMPEQESPFTSPTTEANDLSPEEYDPNDYAPDVTSTPSPVPPTEPEAAPIEEPTPATVEEVTQSSSMDADDSGLSTMDDIPDFSAFMNDDEDAT